MARLSWLTQDAIPGRSTRAISLPDDELWVAQFLGAFLLLTLEESWEEFGALTPLEMSDEWRAIFLEFVEGTASMIPIGTILPFGGDTAPSGFFMCDGSPFVRADFASLFAVIGVFYGAGNGTTTANLPNLRGKVPVGLDSSQVEFDTLGESGGAKTHTLLTAEIPSHNHVQDSHNHLQNSHNHTANPHTHVQTAHNHTQNSHSHAHIAHSHNRNPSGLSETVFDGTAGSGAFGGAGGTRSLPTYSGTQAATTTENVATAVNVATTPTNQDATNVNIATTPLNQAAVATNQAAGGGGAHANLQPYLVLNYIIKY
jgi:microcystin-dependent protein